MTYFLVAGGFSLVALSLLFTSFMHVRFKAPRATYGGDPSGLDMHFRNIIIPASNGQRLPGWHLLASHHPNAPTVLIMHGWGANRDMMLPLAQIFYRAGMNCLLFDARNHGHGPEDGISSLPKFAADCKAAIDWLRQRKNGKGPLVLLGHSLGAGAVLLEASRRTDIDAVISIASFAHPLWLMQRHLQRPYKSLTLLRMVSPLVMAYTQWIIGEKFEDIAPMNAICDIKCPVLLVHGNKDQIIPLDDMRAIAEQCPDQKNEALIVEGAGHESLDKISQHKSDLLDFLYRHNILHHHNIGYSQPKQETSSRNRAAPHLRLVRQ